MVNPRLLLILLLAGCPVTEAAFDQDGDGYVAVEAGGDDCDDRNPGIFPGAPEVCGNGFDDSCDGLVDRVYAADDSGSPQGAAPRIAQGTFYFLDEDRDGFGRDDEYLEECEVGGVVIGARHFVAEPGDCDDTDPTVHPDATDDDCDGRDDDCDEVPDQDADPDARWWPDRDADGFGDDSNPARAHRGCPPSDDPQIPTWALPGGDCDDLDPDRNPGAEEICDRIDNNCQGGVDETVVGDGPECPGESCKHIHQVRAEAGSGTFFVGDPTAPIEVACEASGTHGRGWTSVTLRWMKESGTTQFQAFPPGGSTTWQTRAGRDVIRLNPDNRTNGRQVMVRAHLPFTFSEVRGSWVMEGYSETAAGSHWANDYWIPAPVWRTPDSSGDGDVLFGTRSDPPWGTPEQTDIKKDGWGFSWACGTIQPGGCTASAFSPRSFAISGIAPVTPTSSVIRWSYQHTEGASAQVELTDVQLFVR